jgi:hypothetical protein
VGGYKIRGRLRVTLPGLPPIEDTSQVNLDGNFASLFEITYRAAMDSDTITVVWSTPVPIGPLPV